MFVDLPDNAACRGNPLEGLRVLVIDPDVVVDGADEVANAPECSAADSFASDLGKPPFDLVEPGRVARREVHVVTRPCWQPTFHFRLFVSSIVVEHQMNRQLSIDRLVDPIKKVQELLMPMPRLAFANHSSLENIQRRE